MTPLTDTPRVSIVIPCYNGGADLPGAIESLKKQTFGDIEVLVVDDGSNDPKTLEVLESLPGGVRLIRQRNKGLAAARNSGMKAARGELLLPLDCDDRLKPTFLERTVAMLDQAPEAWFTFCWLELHGEKSGVLEKDYNYFAQLFLNQLPYCLLMRREVWEKTGGYDETMRRGYEDWEFNVRAGRMGYTGVPVREALFEYRVSGSGMLQSLSNRLHAQLWRDIQKRNEKVFTVAALWALWEKWKSRPLPYPAPMLFALFAIHKVLPPDLFNKAFAWALRFSASSREQAAPERQGG